MAGHSDVLVGLQYGDEGKARIIDFLAKHYDIVARFNGGPNAGHTVETEKGRLVLNQIPSAVFNEAVLLYIGSGCVLNPEVLVGEIAKINALDINLEGRLHISSQATVIQPHHIMIDSMTGGSIGTTGNGIGPAYADRANRMIGERLVHLKVGDFVADFGKAMEYAINNVFELKHLSPKEVKELWGKFEKAFEVISPYVEQDTLFLHRQVEAGKNVLFEGAQAFMLDVVKGTIPYVTSSHTVAGNAYVGGDLSPRYHRKTIGVAKAIMSRVGNGPFASEFGRNRSEVYCMEDGGKKYIREVEANLDVEKLLASADYHNIGIALRILGNEYGARTGRPRRVGALDLVQLAYAVAMNGVDELYITKADMLRDFARTDFKGIPIVDNYTLNGASINYIPGSSQDYRNVHTEFKVVPGFDQDISGAKAQSELPQELTDLLKQIEHTCNCKVKGIGVGPRREQFVYID